MTAKLADRVKETSTTTGTGTLNLDGAVSNFQTFVAGIGTGNACYYAIVHQTATEWEVGIGTVTDASPDTLSRTTILASSNSGSAVSLSSGTKDVFCTAAADSFTLGGMVQIGTVTLGSDNATLATFSSIPDSYNDLVLMLTARLDGTTARNIWIRFNGDSGSNYTYQYDSSTNATLSGGGAVTQSKGLIGYVGSTTQNAAAFTSVEVRIPAYRGTTFQKAWLATAYQLTSADGVSEAVQGKDSGRWKNTAAITQIDIVADSGSFKTGSYCSLYGLGRH